MNQNTTLASFHDAYAQATRKPSVNPVEVAQHLMDILEKMLESNMFTSKEDYYQINLFMNKLANCISAREKTFEATNMCTEILNVMMYIVAWDNEECCKKVDVNITARRKSLESELAKAMELANRNIPTQIKDRFGIRFIILNQEDAINLCCFLAPKILNVLCGLDITDRLSFINFTKKLDSDTRERIQKVLDLPFILEEIKRTDDPKQFVHEKHPDVDLPTDEDRQYLDHLSDCMKFYLDPKENGYQSIHFVLGIDSFSKKMPGFRVELQFRTWKMHKYAENDMYANHAIHKSGVDEFTQVFSLSEEEQAQSCISGFCSYKDTENDLDGIHFPKIFSNRRINNISLPNWR